LLSSGFGVESGKAQFSALPPPKADFPILELLPPPALGERRHRGRESALSLSPFFEAVLLAAGAGAGLATAFNAPIRSVAFDANDPIAPELDPRDRAQARSRLQVEFCRGTKPSQAANSQPERNTFGSATVVAIAVAMMGPSPECWPTAD
jgi:hypothetical protein